PCPRREPAPTWLGSTNSTYRWRPPSPTRCTRLPARRSTSGSTGRQAVRPGSRSGAAATEYAESEMTGRWRFVLAASAAVISGDPAGNGQGRAEEAARSKVRALVEAGRRGIEDAAYAAAEGTLRDALALAES